MHHDFDYSRTEKFRSLYIPFEKVLKIVEPVKDDVIVDIGSGDGFYSVRFAEKVKRVYAVEANAKGNEILKRRISESGLTNIEIVERDACEGIGLSDFNKVFFSNSFHDIDCREELIRDIVRSASGRFSVILIEFKKDSEVGPPRSMKIADSELKEFFEHFGFRLAKTENLTQHYIHEYVLEKS